MFTHKMTKINKLKCIKTQREDEGCIINGHGVFIYCPACDIGRLCHLNAPVLSDQFYGWPQYLDHGLEKKVHPDGCGRL